MSAILKSIAENAVRTEHRARPQTKVGWQQVVRGEPFTYTRVTLADYEQMSRNERYTYDQDRIRHHSSIDAIATTAFTGAIEALTERLDAIIGNSTVALPGMLLTGPAYAGKSTALIRFGRDVERALRTARGIPLPGPSQPAERLPSGFEYLPVCYFSIDTQVIPTLRNAVRFYNPDLPAGKRYTANDLTAMLLDFVAGSETRLIAMDQMQNLKHAVAGAQAVSEALKNIMDGAPGTMLAGAGVELDAFRVFTEGYRDQDAHLAQTGSRFSLHHMRAYDLDDDQSRKDWMRLLATVERSLDLFHAEPGDLVNHMLYLHEATGGLAGELLPLLRNAANHAVTSNTERITPELLKGLHKAARRDTEASVRSLGASQPSANPRSSKRTRATSHIQTTPAPAVASS